MKRLNKSTKCVNQANTPLLTEEGGRDIKKNAAKPPYSERTGWSLTSHVAL